MSSPELAFIKIPPPIYSIARTLLTLLPTRISRSSRSIRPTQCTLLKLRLALTLFVQLLFYSIHHDSSRNFTSLYFEVRLCCASLLFFSEQLTQSVEPQSLPSTFGTASIEPISATTSSTHALCKHLFWVQTTQSPRGSRDIGVASAASHPCAGAAYLSILHESVGGERQGVTTAAA